MERVWGFGGWRSMKLMIKTGWREGEDREKKERGEIKRGRTERGSNRLIYKQPLSAGSVRF
jgi:hypothetical protein